MIFRRFLSLSLASIFCFSSSLHGQEKVPLKSGLDVGQKATPYHPLLCNGQTTGQRWCMVCTEQSRGNGMIIAFVRELNEPVKKLIQSIEKSTTQHQKLGGIVTLLSTKGKTEAEAEALTGGKIRFLNKEEKTQFAKTKKLAKDLKLKKTNLNTYPTVGPKRYNLSPDAALTLIIAKSDRTVTANFSLKKDELTEEHITQLIKKVNAAVK